MKDFGGRKTEFGIEFFDFDTLGVAPNNPKPNNFRSELAVIVSKNFKTLWENIIQNKTALPIVFILHEGRIII